MLFLSEFSRKGNTTKIFVTNSNINFHEYLSGGSRIVPNVQRNKRTERRTKVQTNLAKEVDILTYLLTYLLAYLLNGAESFLIN
jgi:hypothetical protein